VSNSVISLSIILGEKNKLSSDFEFCVSQALHYEKKKSKSKITVMDTEKYFEIHTYNITQWLLLSISVFIDFLREKKIMLIFFLVSIHVSHF